MKRFIFCILIVVSSLCAHGQSVHDSKVANMMNTQDWFALRAFLNENGDSLNGFIELCASALIDTYFNDPHAAADCLIAMVVYWMQMQSSDTLIC